MKRESLAPFAELAARDVPRMAEALSSLAGVSTPPPMLRARLLDAVQGPRLRYAPFYDALSRLFDLSDRQLSELFERADRAGQWFPSGLPGVELLHLAGGPRVAGADNGLVRLGAGARFPHHHHRGVERVLVLEGGFVDEPSGRIYRAGDEHEMGPGTSHAYVALPERELVLAASVAGGIEVDGFGALSPSTGR